MTSIRETIRRYFSPVGPLPAGVYAYQAPPGAPLPYRLHLRLEPEGDGVLIVNASTILHLNPTAAEYAYHLVQGRPDEETARLLSSRYRVSRPQALQDFRDFKDRLQTLIDTPDLDPESFLDFDRYAPYSQQISAPYRLDCALTYRLSPGYDPGFAPVERVKRDLTLEEWKAIADKAWQAGIPHLVFTGGEPTLFDDLPALIAHAEKNGQVTGLITDGLRLAQPGYLEALLQTGLDHLTLLFQPELELAWDVLGGLIAADLFVVVHLTLTPQNAAKAAAILDRLSQMKAQAVSLSGTDPSLAESLQAVRQRAAELNLSLVWNLPVPYGAFNPVALETAPEAPPEGTGQAWLYVEPDGDVLPAQGVNQVLGNMLADPWEKIWKPIPG
jgi:organic radical activating enzyme